MPGNPIFIGELRGDNFSSESAKKLISSYPDSAIELTVRALKDILADTHPDGMLSYIINERREGSLGFYLGFLDGMRKVLFPEIVEAFRRFTSDHDWRQISRARDDCRAANLDRARFLTEEAAGLNRKNASTSKGRIEKEILLPLGL